MIQSIVTSQLVIAQYTTLTVELDKWQMLKVN